MNKIEAPALAGRETEGRVMPTNYKRKIMQENANRDRNWQWWIAGVLAGMVYLVMIIALINC